MMRTLSSFIILILSAAATVASGDDDTTITARAALALNAENGQRIAAAVVADGDDLAGDGDSPFFVPPLVTEGGTYACQDGGAYTLELATTLAFDFDHCAQAGAVQNGGSTVQLFTLEGDINSSSSDWSLAAAFRFDDFTATSKNERLELDDGGFNGTTRFDASETLRTLAINGSGLSLANNDGAARITNFNFRATEVIATSQYTLRYDLGYDDGNFPGIVTVHTNLPFRNLESFPPESGKLTIAGARNTKVVVEATGGGTARISIDANGDDDFVDSGDRIINGQWTTFFG